MVDANSSKHAIHTLDLNYLGAEGSIASYLIETSAGPVLVESGPGSTQDVLASALRTHGYSPSDVVACFLTHIHLDHAGAAGWLGQQGAMIHAHAFGARHLVDPAKLIASATRIYGDDMERLWGDILPVPADRCQGHDDASHVTIGDATFTAMETPGHARHHHTWILNADSDAPHVAFVGDAAAAVTSEAPEFISLPMPPPEFDFDQWQETLLHLRAKCFDTIYPTHFGAVHDVQAHLDRVRDALSAHVAQLDVFNRSLPTEDVVARYQAWCDELADAAGVPGNRRSFFVKGSLATMNVAGHARWRTKHPA